MKNFILAVSIILNVLLLGVSGLLIINVLNGCDQVPDGKIGVLKKDLEIGYFNHSKKIFTLPKGLVVKDSSATGMGRFEANRFRIVITSMDDDLVAYEGIDLTKLENQSEFYSADVHKFR